MAQTTITPRAEDMAALAKVSPEQRAAYRGYLLAPCPLDGKAGHIWTQDQPRVWRCAGCTVGEVVTDDPERRIAEALAALDVLATLDAAPRAERGIC